jgi:RNA-splicing ligase RtcB
MINLIIVKGKYNEALVFAKAIEANAEDRLRQYLNHPAFANSKTRIMPDVHLGKSAVVGFTTTRKAGTPLIPSVIGVDIGCGVCACNLGRGNLRFDKLDAFIRKNVPAGMDVRPVLHEKLDEAVAFAADDITNSAAFKNELRDLCEKQAKTPERVFASLGTLGGGNHFIEIDKDEDNNRWLLIHSGSRILGARTAEYHEVIALRETDEESPIKYLRDNFADDYLADMRLVQFYARVNRLIMAITIAGDFFKQDITATEYRDSVHNYLDFTDLVVRKGAISAHKDEPVVIPFSMSEGAILGRGKGNAEWNNSAPHGAGRKISRTQARNGLSLDEYRKQMRGVWSSTVGKDTLEESPMAYKRPKDILEYIGETVDIEKRLTPLYNFKVAE